VVPVAVQDAHRIRQVGVGFAAVKHGDRVACSVELSREGCADESGAAENKNPHDRNFRGWSDFQSAG
jgi:hypothetical protein